MNKNTKITLAELMARKEQMLEKRKTPVKQQLYIKSLDGTITIEAPTAALAVMPRKPKTVMRTWFTLAL